MDNKTAGPARFDFDTGSVLIPVLVNGEDFECEVTHEALEDHFGMTSSGDALAAYAANRQAIDERILKEANGGVPRRFRLGTKDF
jgi:hypothetical protein